MRKNVEVIDDEGNTMPVPGQEASDVEKAIYLLEYARLRSFRIGPTLKGGDLVVQVRDLRQEAQLSRDQREAATPDLVPGTDMHTLLAGDKDGDE